MKRWFAPGLVAIVAAWIASSTSSLGDWRAESWPKVHALAQGDVSLFLHLGSSIGPFAAIVEAPFVAISGGDGLVAYRWAAFPCLLAVGLVGIYLALLA